MNKQDELVMKMLHYFITERNYNPIVMHGITNEIWLENLDEKYRVVRIISNHIHNDDQMDFDIFKTKKICKQIKSKTLTLSLNVLNIYIDLGDNVNLGNFNINNMKCININKINDFKKYSDILELYPKIDITEGGLKGMELFMKLTTDISKKTESDALESEKVFSMKTPIITYILIAINIIMFLAMYLFGNGSTDINTLLFYGANNSTLVKMGDYYRLISAIFLHIGVIHLACNMYALYVIGPQLESFYGKLKFVIIYLLGGIIGNLFANIFEINTVGAGASGAIFALFGSLLYFGYHYRVYLGNVIKTRVVPIILLNLMIGFMYNNISNAAHIGGLIGGVLISMALGVPNKGSSDLKIHGTILSIIFVGFLIYMSIFR